MIPVDYDDDRPLYVQAADSIKASIASGEYPKGGVLPGREVLADLLGVAEQTLVKATNILKAEGVLAGRRGMGFYVRTRPPEPMAEIAELRRRIERLESR